MKRIHLALCVLLGAALLCPAVRAQQEKTAAQRRAELGIAEPEDDYTPATYALSGGSWETLPSGEMIYNKAGSGIMARSAWIKDRGKYYYVDESGCLAHFTYAHDGYCVAKDGTWDRTEPRLTTNVQPYTNRIYREAGNPEGPYMLFNIPENGKGAALRFFPGAEYTELFSTDGFGWSTYALWNPEDPESRASLAVSPDRKVVLLSQAGTTEKYILE
ncbi:MAG: hypothetical protein K6G86_04655 [Bacteroidales bacterium]|nr:hypothetical protein [Bacteroidales bacterium]